MTPAVPWFSLPTSCLTPAYCRRTSADEAATSSGDDEDSDNPNGAAPTAAAKTTHAAAAAGAAAAAQPARSRLGQNGSSGAAAKERMAECDLRRQVRHPSQPEG